MSAERRRPARAHVRVDRPALPRLVAFLTEVGCRPRVIDLDLVEVEVGGCDDARRIELTFAVRAWALETGVSADVVA